MRRGDGSRAFVVPQLAACRGRLLRSRACVWQIPVQGALLGAF